jgi:heme/copper-type cytochrome/quinol oxidase subunit 2
MVAAETVITGFVIAVMVVVMGIMVYLAFATQDDASDDSAAETSE